MKCQRIATVAYTPKPPQSFEDSVDVETTTCSSDASHQIPDPVNSALLMWVCDRHYTQHISSRETHEYGNCDCEYGCEFHPPSA
jgi:hypothetical protein